MSQVKEIRSDNFEQEVLNSEVPVLVDFYAPWCDPCRQLSPELDKLALNLGDRGKVVKVNVDEEGLLADTYKVMSMPTLLFFNGGEVFHTHGGIMSAHAMEARLLS